MKRHKGNRWQGVLLGTFLGVSSLFAQQGQTGYQPTPENLQARQEFSDSKFGIFLHWGIYSMFGQGEWYMETSGIDCHEYAKAASGFYPSRFNAKEWVAAIKASGAKYICITTRHHDGFSMFDTRYSDYDIIDVRNRESNCICIILTLTGRVRIIILTDIPDIIPDVPNMETGIPITSL